MVLLWYLMHEHMCMQRQRKIPENNPTKEVIIVEENSGLTINNIPKIATIIAMI